MNSDYIRSLPPQVKKRINALKNLQKKHMETEVEFHKEFHMLELKYQEKMSELTQQVIHRIHPTPRNRQYVFPGTEPKYNSNRFQRKKVVLGEYEPTETECEWNYDEEEDDEENQVKIEEVNEKSGEVKDETSNSEMVCSLSNMEQPSL